MMKDHSFGFVVFFDNQDGKREFLLINQKTDYGTFWGYPKGHPEKGETGLQAAKRELFEEVGIKDIQVIGDKTFETEYIVNSISRDKYAKAVTFWIGKVKNKSIIIQEEELNGYKWADFDTALGLMIHSNYKTILKNVVKYLGQ